MDDGIATTSPSPIDYSTDATCLTCGYQLRGLPEPRCPECGRAFDPFRPGTMKVPGYPPRPASKPKTFGGEIIATAVFATFLCIAGTYLACGVGGLLGLAAWTGVIFAWRRRGKAGKPLAAGALPDGPSCWRGVVKFLLVVTVLFSFRFHACPHATTLSVGPFGLSYSTAGGPCRNAPHRGGEHLSGNWYFAGLGG